MILRPPRSTRTDTLFPYPTLFRSHDTGNASDGEHVALFGQALSNRVSRFYRHRDAAVCNRLARRYGLARNVHHMGRACLFQVRTLDHFPFSSTRVAFPTSAHRLRPSPTGKPLNPFADMAARSAL